MHATLLASLLTVSLFGASPQPEAVVVCPEPFRGALQPWLERRAAEGMRVAVVDSAPTAEQVRANMLAVGWGPQTRYVVLVGDAPSVTAGGIADPRFQVPTDYHPTAVTARFGSTAQLASDALYGDRHGDGFPDAAVGRMPVQSAEQLESLVQRIAAYEESRDFGPWRETVQLTAGLGGFGMLADAAIETAARAMITGILPAAIHTRVTHAAPTSPYNPGTDDFFPTVLRRYREGSMFWVYAGHGHVTELDRVPSREAGRAVLSCEDCDLLDRPASASPIALLLACYTGAFDAAEDCLAERMIRAEGGPIAVIAGSRVTMPYGNAIFAGGLIEGFFDHRADRLGEVWRLAQRHLSAATGEDPRLDERRKMLDTVAALVSPTGNELDAERREHLLLYNLLGDPTLRIRYPQLIELDVPSGAAAGTPIEIRGVAPQAGELTVSVRHRPGSARTIDRSLAAAQRYEKANRLEVLSARLEHSPAGPFVASLRLPEGVSGPLTVVARVESEQGWSVGSASMLVRPR